MITNINWLAFLLAKHAPPPQTFCSNLKLYIALPEAKRSRRLQPMLQLFRPSETNTLHTWNMNTWFERCHMINDQREHIKGSLIHFPTVSDGNTHHPVTPPIASWVATEYFSAAGPELLPNILFHHLCFLTCSAKSITSKVSASVATRTYLASLRYLPHLLFQSDVTVFVNLVFF